MTCTTSSPARTLPDRSAAGRIAGVVLTILALAACAPRPAPEVPLRSVRVMTVGTASTQGTDLFAAEVRARSESRLSFRVAGKLVRREAEVGQRVRAGALLASLDPEDLRQAKRAADAALAAAQSNLDLARSDWQRFADLHRQGFISAAELERRNTALKVAQSQLEQARAQAVVQGNQAGYAALVAPEAGIVTSVDVEPGAVVAAGQTVLRLAFDGPRDAVFSIPEDRLAQFRPLIGRQGALSVRLWSGGEPIPTTLREIAAAADPVTRTFQAKADLGRAEVQLGQTATVLASRPRLDGVIRLPLTAVTAREGRSTVFVLDRSTMTVQPVPVTVAAADGNELVIAHGLTSGQDVVVAGLHVLTPGQKVRLYEERTGSTTGAASSPSR